MSDYFVIRITGIQGVVVNVETTQQGYIRSFDPDANDGLGHLRLTEDLEVAKKFNTGEDAQKFLDYTSPSRTNLGGAPNQPLHAYSGMILKILDKPKFLVGGIDNGIN